MPSNETGGGDTEEEKSRDGEEEGEEEERRGAKRLEVFEGEGTLRTDCGIGYGEMLWYLIWRYCLVSRQHVY